MEISFTLSTGAHTQPKIKLQYMKNTSKVIHVHVMMVSIRKNMLEQAHVINKLGRFGTGVPLAPWQTCGKPSTKFPHGGLVECPFLLHSFSKFPTISLNFQIFTSNEDFIEILIFSKF